MKENWPTRRGVLTREAEEIRRFDLSKPLVLRSRITEVDRLVTAMKAMKSALATFGAYVPRDLVRQLPDAGTTPRVGGERRPLSIMFTDIEGFTSVAETLEPEQLARIASVYFEGLTAELLDAGATIDKYIGDAVMALWNAPSPDPDHAAHACRAALRARLLTNRLSERFAERGWPPLPTRFGIHTGEAMVGNVGSRDRMAYTAMGSMVNLAARLEALTRFYGTQILVSEDTKRRAGEALVFRSVDLVYPKGAAVPTAIHELIGEADSASKLRHDAPITARLPAWELCVEAYRAGRFAEAWDALQAAGGAEADTLSAVYAARLEKLREAPVAADWNPAIRYAEKRHPSRPAPDAPRKRIKLALQGGGSHGAFTWGVLDRLPENERLTFEAVVGTSAGAMNATLFVDGLIAAGPVLARRVAARRVHAAAAVPARPVAGHGQHGFLPRVARGGAHFANLGNRSSTDIVEKFF